MIRYLLDTDMCIYVIKKKPKSVIERFKQSRISEVGISSITLSELEYAIFKSSKPEQNQIALNQFLAPMEIAFYGDEAARHYGRLRTFLEKQGTPIGSLDVLIAAHAISLDCILVTNKEKEFIRVPHLKIENWVA